MWYFWGIEDFGLYFWKDIGVDIVGYIDFGFKIDKIFGKF